MEETVSGFEVQGDWADVVEHGERITAALDAAGCDGPLLEEWNEWRPKAPERMNEEIREKTAEQAHVNEGSGEKANQSPSDDLMEAGDRLVDAYADLDQAAEDHAVREWYSSLEHVKRAADSAGRKLVRSIEDVVYKQMMTKVAPFYFDNELVSANLRQASRAGPGAYVFEVNVNDDDLKSSVSDYLSTMEAYVPRWHIDVDVETDPLEDAEGVELPE